MTTPVHRRYLREFLPAMAAYAVVLFLSMHALKWAEATWLRVLLCLLPILPIGFAARALLRYVRDCDEMQRRIQLEAFALASLVLTMGSFSLGLLAAQDLVTLPADAVLIWILPLYCLLYGGFAAFIARRYR